MSLVLQNFQRKEAPEFKMEVMTFYFLGKKRYHRLRLPIAILILVIRQQSEQNCVMRGYTGVIKLVS